MGEGGEGEGRGKEGNKEGKSKRCSLLHLTLTMHSFHAQPHIHSIHTSTDLNHTHPLSTLHCPAFLYGPGASLRNEMPTLMWLSTDTLTLHMATSSTK